jgi:glycosyltransferase involved in cell wall biosynthesis
VLLCAARSHDVTLLTQPSCAEKVHAALAGETVRPVAVVPISGPRCLHRFEGRWGLGHLDYAIWQFKAWRAARRLRATVDVAHHATFGTDWMPSAMLFLRDVPIVWGPVGGTSRFPWRLLRFIAPADLASELAREVITRAFRLLTASLAKRSSCLVVARNREVQARFDKLGLRTVVEPLVGLPAAQERAQIDRADGGMGRTCRALYISRLTSWKGAFLAVHAMAALPDDWHLDMFGEGRGAERIRRLSRRLGVDHRVHLLGRRPRDEVFQALDEADVLLFPSMRDSAPYPVVEALRSGCPVVCLDAAGPPQLIDGTSSLAVAPDRHAPRRLAGAMMSVRRQPPDDRWSLERLGSRVDQWYCRVVEEAGRS